MLLGTREEGGDIVNTLKVFELRLKVYLLQDIEQQQTYEKMGSFIDSCLAKDKTQLELHEKNCFKQYVFDQFYPVQSDGIYKKDQIYTVRIRTVNVQLAQYFSEKLVNHFNQQIKGLTLEMRVIPKKFLSQLYTITPAVIKYCGSTADGESGGYWKTRISFEQYEERLKVNLIKKYNVAMNTSIDEDFDLYQQIELTNRKPIAIPYKGIRLLGDKLKIQVADNAMAQELAYFAIGVGLCELNARGLGFVNYRYL